MATSAVHAPARLPTVPVVYLVRNPATGLLKIGRTDHLARRLRQLEQGSGVGLELVAYIAAPADVPFPIAVSSSHQEIERQLHALLAPHRVFGEWFDDHPRVRSRFGAPSSDDVGQG